MNNSSLGSSGSLSRYWYSAPLLEWLTEPYIRPTANVSSLSIDRIPYFLGLDLQIINIEYVRQSVIMFLP
jgi:hypothetical protein